MLSFCSRYASLLRMNPPAYDHAEGRVGGCFMHDGTSGRVSLLIYLKNTIWHESIPQPDVITRMYSAGLVVVHLVPWFAEDVSDGCICHIWMDASSFLHWRCSLHPPMFSPNFGGVWNDAVPCSRWHNTVPLDFFIFDYWISLASSTRTRGLRQHYNGSGIFSMHRLKSRLKYHLGRPLGQTLSASIRTISQHFSVHRTLIPWL